MDEQTRSILQSLLDQISNNTKSIAALHASNALQTHVIIALLGHMNEGTKFSEQFRESYLSIRKTSLDNISISDQPEAIDAFLSVLDEKFL